MVVTSAVYGETRAPARQAFSVPHVVVVEVRHLVLGRPRCAAAAHVSARASAAGKSVQLTLPAPAGGACSKVQVAVAVGAKRYPCTIALEARTERRRTCR